MGWTTFALGYLGGWVVTTFVVLLASRHARDPRCPAPHLAMLSIVAGAVWPLLVLGLFELSSVALCARSSRTRLARVVSYARHPAAGRPVAAFRPREVTFK